MRLSYPFLYLCTGLTMSISQPCFPNVGDVNHLIGIVGVDLHMEDIVQDITYYNPGDGSYAFVVTTDGQSQFISNVILFSY